MTENAPSSSSDPARPDTSSGLVPLGGGVANAGAVFRRGSMVIRPAALHSAAVQSLMGLWRQAGINEVPEPLGFEPSADGRGTNELVRYVEGRVGGPNDDWAAAPEALISVASIQKRLHAAARNFRAEDLTGPWGASGYIPPAFVPPTVSAPLACHNDLCVSNIVFAPERPDVVAVIDWDYAQPVDPVFDIAVAMRHWVPFAHPADRAPAWADVDAVERFALWADIMAFGADDKGRVLDVAVAFLDQAHGNVADLARRGVGGFASLVEGGYLDRNRRDRQWIVANRDRLVA